MVGADGAWSPVRQQAGIEFPGPPGNTVSYLADVELDAAPQNATHVWDHADGWVSIVPLFDGIHRVFGVLPEDTGLTPEKVTARRSQPLTLEDLRGILKRVAGTDYGLRNAVWISTAGNTTRHATRYRVNRVFVAGDAAHVHFPAGGQGVNVGMQDGVNLAWKLAAEIKGQATPLITGGAASYDRERRPVAESLAQNTQAQTALMTTFTPQGAALRELMSTLLARPETNAHLAGLLSGLSVSYDTPDAGHPLDGHRAPNLRLPDGDTVLRRLRVDRFLLLDFTPAGELAALDSSAVEVVPAGPWSGLAAALVRPDGYIARAWSVADADQVRAALTDWGAS
ncbi:FAD-dependent monooxygenase [Streptomyces sp. NPDC020192]|uniref:FAD-dependent monooxygenase n=1 Tax=Streptomyces sp. NPDC020192 TaxID=3365066 RepID=UPI0037B1D653